VFILLIVIVVKVSYRLTMHNGNNDCYYDKEENDDGNEGEFYHLVFVGCHVIDVCH
jgi:ribosomal 30S subunit maturation factor RimM